MVKYTGWFSRIQYTGFLKLPEIENTSKKPQDPYDIQTTGRLHSAKFSYLLDYLTTDLPKEQLENQLEGHRLQFELLTLTDAQLADFCRHVANANRSIIGWEEVDDILLKLDAQYIPRWKLPNFDFQVGFKEIFSTIVNFKVEPFTQELILSVLDSPENNNRMNRDYLVDKFSSDFQYWNYKDFSIIFDLLVNYHNNGDEEKARVRPLINEISEIYLEQIRNKGYTLYQQIALTFLFTNSYVKLGKEEVTKSQDLIDRVWRMAEKQSEQEVISFRYLFGAAYSLISFYMLESPTDFVTKRRLIGSLLSNFISPKEVELVDWFWYLITEKVEPLLMAYLLHGYSHILPILQSEINELPECEIKDNLHNIMLKLTTSLHSSMVNYLGQEFSFKLYEVEPSKFYETIDAIEMDPSLKYYILTTLLKTIRIRLFSLDFDGSLTQRAVEIGAQIEKHIYGENNERLFRLDMKLFLRTYDFESIMSNIKFEIEDTHSIILSSTFENLIINEISKAMEFLFEMTRRSQKIDIEKYEIVLSFTSEWLQYFANSTQLYNEALMVLSPIISICFVQITRGYYHQNLPEKAFLTYFCMHYFVELFVNELKLTEVWIVDDSKDHTRAETINNKYEKLISDWHFHSLMDLTSLKNMVNSIAISMGAKSPGSGLSSSLSGMVEDDVIFGYLDISKDLEEFIKNYNAQDGIDFVAKFIRSASLYSPPNHESHFRLNRLGSSLSESQITALPFPIIRNVHEMSRALQMFPLEVALPELLSKQDLIYQSLETGTNLDEIILRISFRILKY